LAGNINEVIAREESMLQESGNALPHVVYSFSETVRVPLPEPHQQRALEAVNRALGWIPTWEDCNRAEVIQAHRRIRGSYEQLITVDVYSDGTRRIRMLHTCTDPLTDERDSIPIARTEQAQESTTVPATFDHYTEPVKAQDGQRVLAHGHKCVGVEVEPNYAAVATERFQDAPRFTTSGKLFTARHLPMCANCSGTERVIEGGKQIDCPVCT
jgi:hypothetical protein